MSAACLAPGSWVGSTDHLIYGCGGAGDLHVALPQDSLPLPDDHTLSAQRDAGDIVPPADIGVPIAATDFNQHVDGGGSVSVGNRADHVGSLCMKIEDKEKETE